MARKGDLASQMKLAEMYTYGKGVPQDKREGVKWYRVAAERGEKEAQFWLGMSYYEGTGVPKNDGESLRWLLRSANAGFRLAQSILGETYEEGDGAPKDLTEAYKWYLLANANGGMSHSSVTKLEAILSPSQRADGQRRARDFQPKATEGP
jgi:TPR repeat protein